MSQLVTFRASSSPVKRVEHLGRNYLSAPVMAIREGVLNGELALTAEFGKYPEAWNGIPVPLGHPQDAEGHYISANTPDIVGMCPGRFWFARVDGDRLAGEIWIDVADATALGGEALEVLNRLNRGDAIEVSTAYFRDLEETPGEWNGESYNGIQRNFRPDHLALLLHERGGCDWEMGCGVPRVNSGGQAMTDRVIQINVEMSLDEQLSRVYDAFYEQFISKMPPMPEGPNIYIREVFAERIIVKSSHGLFAYPYEMDADGNVIFGEPYQVEIVYQPVANNQQATGPETPAAPPTEEPPAANAESQPEPVLGETTTPDALVLTANDNSPCADLRALVDEFGGPAAVLETLNQMRINAVQERTTLITEIRANERSTFSQEDLAAMSADQLRKLRDSLRPVDYSGRNVPRSRPLAGGALVEAPMPQ